MTTFGSVCSGIEAASVAWGPLGWRAAWLSEIEPFPCAVLAHHYPEVPNLGDMTTLAARIRAGEVSAPDVFCGGTPCQAFSVAGLRRSLDDARGNLSLTFCEIANELDTTRLASGRPPVVVFWENVPGVLSTADNAFGCFLAGLSGSGDALVPEPCPAAGKSSRFWRWQKATGCHTPKWPSAGAVLGPQRAVAWRVMDAQYTGVAQRRRRVFVVASAREGFDPAAVLFEFDGVRRDSAPSREQGQGTAGRTIFGADGGCKVGHVQPVTATLDASYGRLHGASNQDANHDHSHLVTAFGGNRCGGSIDVAPALLAQPGSGYKGDFESETFLVQPIAHVDTMPTMMAGGPSDTSHNQISGQMRESYIVPMVTHSLRGEGFDASEDGTGRGTPLVPVVGFPRGVTIHGTDPTVQKVASYDDLAQCLRARTPGNIDNSSTTVVEHPIAFDTTQITSAENRSNPKPGDPCHPLTAGAHAPAIAFDARQSDVIQYGDMSGPLDTDGHTIGVAYTTKLHNTGANNAGKIFEERTTALDACSPPPALLTAMQVRRLTPVECERLQDFPDGYTAIPWRGKAASECPDGPRYKALGNSWAVSNVRRIGARIDAALQVLEHDNDNDKKGRAVA